jgi:uncharacterized membrane protein YfcA
MSNPLAQLPPEIRLWAYVVLGLVFAGATAWQAADGDWLKALGLFMGSLGFTMASSNTPKKPIDQRRDRERRTRNR